MTGAATPIEVSDAVMAADRTRDRLAAPDTRRGVLNALAEAMTGQADHIVHLAAGETHLAEPRLRAELARTTKQLQTFAQALEDGAVLEAMISPPDPAAKPAASPDLRSVLQPLGVVAIFSASNFPFAFSVLGGDTASALAAGCPVVVKAHPGHPHLSDAVRDLAREAVGTGLVQVVHGQEEGLDLVAHPLVRAVSFTGSITGALALQSRIHERKDPIPFYGELGSVNPVVVMPKAATTEGPSLLRQLVASYTQSAGQLCTKPGLVLVPAGSELPGKLAEALRTVAPRRMLSPGIRERFDHQVQRLCGIPGVRVLAAPDGRSRDETGPVAFSAHAGDLPDVALDEVFGPMTLVALYESLDEVLAVLSRVGGTLTGSVHTHQTDDPDSIRRVVEALTQIAGRVIHNGWPTGVAVVPAMNHGGPWPSATNALHTSVGPKAARRFMRPVCYQDMPDTLLPAALQDANPLGIQRTIDGTVTRDPIHGPAGSVDG